jgi:23S rRNA (pseudouridine1915-N3)-methyltransferase
MKLTFLSVGKKHDPELAGAIMEFTNRISHYAPVEWKIVPAGENASSESKSILSALNETDFVALLDESGKELGSVELSEFLNTRLNASTKRLVFIIGGAFGVDDSVRSRANSIISFSKLTFPHQLMRLILAEQIYRAFTILKGEKYHHS